MASSKKIFVVGGTGAQGIPVIRGLVSDGTYSVRVLTRDVNSDRAKHIVDLKPDAVELVSGTFASEEDLRNGLRGCWGAFINIDGFNSGEKTEMFWTIRAYELAIAEGIQFFVLGNLDYVGKKSGYRPEFRAGHYDGKGRIGEWILQQTKANPNGMGAALFTTGPYIEMTISKATLMTPSIENGVATWRAPLADGAVMHVSLDDCEYYVRWLFDNRERSNGMDLEVGIDHMTYDELAAAFSKVTGHPAKFINMTMEQYWNIPQMAALAPAPSGFNADLNDPAAMTIKQNFTGFWNIWQHSGGNKGIIQRDYKLLDEIHPNRVRSAEDFFEREDKKGQAAGLGSLWDRVQKENLVSVLKIGEEGGRKGRL